MFVEQSTEAYVTIRLSNTVLMMVKVFLSMCQNLQLTPSSVRDLCTLKRHGGFETGRVAKESRH